VLLYCGSRGEKAEGDVAFERLGANDKSIVIKQELDEVVKRSVGGNIAVVLVKLVRAPSLLYIIKQFKLRTASPT
jgi:hypothetical protein